MREPSQHRHLNHTIGQSADSHWEYSQSGRAVAVVLSRREYDRLTGARESLVDFMRRSPLYGLDDLEFPREQGLARDNPL